MMKKPPGVFSPEGYNENTTPPTVYKLNYTVIKIPPCEKRGQKAQKQINLLVGEVVARK